MFNSNVADAESAAGSVAADAATGGQWLEAFDCRQRSVAYTRAMDITQSDAINTPADGHRVAAPIR